jgi:hypothetical protein
VNDHAEKDSLASTISTSTSSDYMGPHYGHPERDLWEEEFGIFAVNSLLPRVISEGERYGRVRSSLRTLRVDSRGH